MAQEQRSWAQSFYDPLAQQPSTQPTSAVNATGAWKKSFYDTSIPEVQFGEADRSAEFGTLVKTGFIDDPQTKIKVFAQQRGISPERYRIIDNEIYYQALDGKFYKESPEGFLGGAKEFAAGLVSDIPGIALGTAGAIGGAALGAPGGPAGVATGAIAGSGAGSAAGEAVRQEIASNVFGQPRDWENYSKQIAQSFLIGAAGEGVGRLIGRGVQAFKERGAVSDVAKLNIEAANRLAKLSQEKGIQLTPAEMSGLKSLINQQWLLSNLPQSSDTIEAFLKNRNTDVQRAMYDFFDTLSKNASPYEGFIKGAKTVDERLMMLKEARKEASQKFYQASYPEMLPKEVVSELNADPLIAKALKTVKSEPVWNRSMRATVRSIKDQNVNQVKEMASLGVIPRKEAEKTVKEIPDNALGWYDLAKRQLNDKSDALRIAGNNAEASQYEQAAKTLTERIDAVSPNYKQARNEFARLSKPINELEESIVGGFVAADSQQAQRMGKVLFGPNSSPEAIKQAKDIIQAADPASWNNVVRSHLQSVLESTVRDSQTGTVQNLGGIYRKKLFGSEQQRKMLRESLDPKQYQALRDLMEVLEATGSSFKGQSITVPGGYIASDLAEDAAKSAPFAEKIAKVATTVGRPLSWPEMAKAKMDEIRLGKYSEQLAKIITSPDSMRMLRENTLLLRQMSPREKALSPLLTRTITQIVEGQSPTEARQQEENDL